MADLITQADVVARMGVLNASQLARVDALISDASGLARLEAPWLESATNEAVVLQLNGDKLTLPSGPVQSITSVHQVANPTDLLVPSMCWTFDGIDTITIATGGWAVVNMPEAWWAESASGTFRVVYSHGFTTVPPEIIGVVANMVIRVLASPSLVEGLTGENIGQYGYQMSQAAGAAGAGVRVTAADRQVLRSAKFRRTWATIETPMGA